jgi:hypothetical protein
MDPRSDLPEDGDHETPEEERPSYRLPADIFRDPFEEDGAEPQAPELFLPAFLGLDDDEPEAPSLAAQGAARERAPLTERLASFFQGLTEGRGDRFAGADVSAPSPLDRLRPRRRSPASGPQEGRLGAGALALDDPFARLLTPLAGPELARLKADVANDEALFLRYERSRRSSLRRQGWGLMLALATMIVFVARAGRGYFHRNLVDDHAPHWMITLLDKNPPHWLTSVLGSNPSGGVLFVLGILVLFLTLTPLTDAFTYLLRALADRSLVDLAIAVLSASFAAAILFLLVHAFPFQALVALGVWFGFRFIIDLVARPD